jgi:acetyl esterase/lipase
VHTLRVTRVVVRAGGQPLRSVAVRPDDEETRRLVLWIHGGGWQEGAPSPVEVAWWARRGAAVLALGYRLSDAARWPRQLDDLRAGVVAGLAALGPVRRSALVAGSSAGAHLALHLACRGLATEGGASPAVRVAGCAAVHPPVDPLAPDYARARAPGSVWRRLLGGRPEHAGELARHASVTSAAADVVRPVPILLLHGDADRTVPFSQSVRAAEALRAAGCPVVLERLSGAGHEPELPRDRVRDLLWAFLTSLHPALPAAVAGR